MEVSGWVVDIRGGLEVLLLRYFRHGEYWRQGINLVLCKAETRRCLRERRLGVVFSFASRCDAISKRIVKSVDVMWMGVRRFVKQSRLLRIALQVLLARD